MRVHHLNCGTMHPPTQATIVAHVFLVERDATAGGGLVLVDTGFGLSDYADPKTRLGAVRRLLRPEPDESLTALRQVEALGWSRDDVSDIVVTHMDLDHIGGLSDFPGATVHTTADEYAAAVTDPDRLDRQRYRPVQWAHGPSFRTHVGRGDEWAYGLTGHEVVPGITLVPMPGHSRGHAAVAVDAGERGVLVHAGDAAFDASSYAAASPSGRALKKVPVMRAFERVVGRDQKAISANHATLHRLDGTDGVTVVPAHDRRIYDDLKDA